MQRNPRLRLALATTALAALTACGGGGSITTAAPTSPQITGLAATGAPLSGATIAAKCASGAEVSTTSASDGSYTLTLNGGQAFPCMLKASTSTLALYSWAAAAGRANLTPLTQLALARALAVSPATAYTGFGTSYANTIASALNAAQAYVLAEMTALLGRAPTIDLFTGVFKVGDSNDTLLDSFAAALKSATKTLDDVLATAFTGASLKTYLTASSGSSSSSSSSSSVSSSSSTSSTSSSSSASTSSSSSSTSSSSASSVSSSSASSSSSSTSSSSASSSSASSTGGAGSAIGDGLYTGVTATASADFLAMLPKVCSTVIADAVGGKTYLNCKQNSAAFATNLTANMWTGGLPFKTGGSIVSGPTNGSITVAFSTANAALGDACNLGFAEPFIPLMTTTVKGVKYIDLGSRTFNFNGTGNDTVTVTKGGLVSEYAMTTADGMYKLEMHPNLSLFDPTTSGAEGSIQLQQGANSYFICKK